MIGEEMTAYEINKEIQAETSEDISDILAGQRQKEECHFWRDE